MIWVGTSGYNYPEWRGSFYPPGFPTSQMLAFYVRHFPSVEINYTSYHFPTQKNVLGWAGETPSDFKLALKVPRRLTFTPPGPKTGGLLRTFCELAAGLGPKQAPVLMQLAPGMPLDLDFLRKLLELVPEGPDMAIELRDASWHTDEVYELLRGRRVAMCISDSEELQTPLVQTSHFSYFRLRHEGYSDADVERWSTHVADSRGDAFVYFKHEGTGSGPRYASLLMDFLSLQRPAG
jgi:uncharacterized protein YecE (DUF72 family)